MALPSLDHFSYKDFEEIYEPAEDTFLLIDSLEADSAELVAAAPDVVLEIGPGSGAVSTFIGQLLRREPAPHADGAEQMGKRACRPLHLAIDVNPRACTATAATAAANGVSPFEVVQVRHPSCVISRAYMWYAMQCSAVRRLLRSE